MPIQHPGAMSSQCLDLALQEGDWRARWLTDGAACSPRGTRDSTSRRELLAEGSAVIGADSQWVDPPKRPAADWPYVTGSCEGSWMDDTRAENEAYGYSQDEVSTLASDGEHSIDATMTSDESAWSAMASNASALALWDNVGRARNPAREDGAACPPRGGGGVCPSRETHNVAADYPDAIEAWLHSPMASPCTEDENGMDSQDQCSTQASDGEDSCEGATTSGESAVSEPAQNPFMLAIMSNMHGAAGTPSEYAAACRPLKRARRCATSLWHSTDGKGNMTDICHVGASCQRMNCPHRDPSEWYMHPDEEYTRRGY